MTREDAIKEIPLSVFTAYELNFEQYANDACEQFEKLVNKIYDGFESRTCESCKYDRCGCSVQDSIFFVDAANNRELSDLDGFGCNKWKPKDE